MNDEERRRQHQERQHQAARDQLERKIEREGREWRETQRREAAAERRARAQDQRQQDAQIAEEAAARQRVTLADMAEEQRHLEDGLRVMGTPPLLSGGRKRRSVNWWLIAEALVNGVDAGNVAALSGLDYARLRRAIKKSPRLHRYMEDARKEQRMRVDARLRHMEFAGIQVMIDRLSAGDDSVIGPLFQRVARLREGPLPSYVDQTKPDKVAAHRALYEGLFHTMRRLVAAETSIAKLEKIAKNSAEEGKTGENSEIQGKRTLH